MASDAAALALHDLQGLTRVIRRLSGILETTVLTQRAATEARRLLGVHYTSIALLDSPQRMIIRGTEGGRTDEIRRLNVPRGAGVGGKVLVLGKPVSVSDYEQDPSISKDFVNLVVHREGIRGVTGVPIEYANQTLGVLYGGTRDIGGIGDRGQLLMLEIARSIGPLLGAANQAEEGVRQRLQEERQRIGLELHDNLGQLLFGIGTSARRARERISVEAGDVAAELKDIEVQASRAASCLRDALRALAPSTSEEALPAVIRLNVNQFSRRTDIPVHLVVLGNPVDLPNEVEKTVLALVREGLHNVEKHAGASSVVLTLYYGDSEVDIAVQDDGRGLPPDFELHSVPRADRGWGITFLSQRVESLGGRLGLIPNEDGGVTLRASLPAAVLRR
jgi:signal transduction histidine kinase